MAETGQFYVYELIDPRDGRPFYVGKGQNLRARDNHGRGAATLFRIREISAAGYTITHGKRTIGIGWGEFARKKGEDRAVEIPVYLMDLGVGLPA